jgi:hypothetical protein
MQLPIGCILVEQWANEELREAMQSLLEMRCIDFEVKVRILIGGIGIGASTVCAEKIVELILYRELFRAEEKLQTDKQ